MFSVSQHSTDASGNQQSKGPNRRDLALFVWKERITLKSAFIMRETRWTNEDDDRSRKRLIAIRTACVALVLILFASVFALRARTNWIVHVESLRESASASAQVEQPSPPLEAIPATATRQAEVVRGVDGRITKIGGPNPQDVLRDYCRIGTRVLEPVSRRRDFVFRLQREHVPPSVSVVRRRFSHYD